MNSGLDTFMGPFVAERAVAGPSEYEWSKVGFPIRKSSDQSSFAAPQGLSQRTTSFIASQRQGIHRTPLRHLITLMIDARRLHATTIDRKTIARGSLSAAGTYACQSDPRPRRREMRRRRFTREAFAPEFLASDSSSRFQTSTPPSKAAGSSMTPNCRVVVRLA